MQIQLKDKSETIYGTQIDYSNETEIVLHTRDHDFKFVESDTDYSDPEYPAETTHYCTVCERYLNDDEVSRL